MGPDYSTALKKNPERQSQTCPRASGLPAAGRGRLWLAPRDPWTARGQPGRVPTPAGHLLASSLAYRGHWRLLCGNFTTFMVRTKSSVS